MSLRWVMNRYTSANRFAIFHIIVVQRSIFNDGPVVADEDADNDVWLNNQIIQIDSPFSVNGVRPLLVFQV